MTSPKSGALSKLTGGAVAVGIWVAASPGVVAQERAPGPSSEQTMTLAVTAPDSPASGNGARVTATGSHILRVRNDRSLPLLVLDRGYIDQSAANTPNELIQSLPQAQNLGSPLPALPSRR
jgi:hypothetical protein